MNTGNIVEDGENIEVNLDGGGVDVETSEMHERSKPSRRLLPFSFRRTSTESNSSPLPVAISVRSPSSSYHEDPEVEEDDPEMYSGKNRSHERTRSRLYNEEPELLQGASDSDEESLLQAENAEYLLGSAMRLAEQGTGENFLALSRSPRSDAIELGRRVSTMSDIRGRIDHSHTPLLLHDDEGSVHSLNSQATDTSFIKVTKLDPTTITQDFWEGIVRMMSSDYDDRDVTAPPPSPQPEEDCRSQNSSPPRIITPSTGAATTGIRKWDKLRNTLEAQEKGVSVGHEAQVESQRLKSKTNPLRIPTLGKGQRKSNGKPERTLKTKDKSVDKENFCMALGPIPQPMCDEKSSLQADERIFDVNIRVEDLSKDPVDRAMISDSFDAPDEEQPKVNSRLDPNEAESMEVVYLVSESPTDEDDILPPFPSKVFEVPT